MKSTRLLVLALVLVAALAGCNKHQLTSGYVCNKHFEPAHLVGKTPIPDTYTVTISVSRQGCSELQAEEYEVTRQNYDFLRLGDLVQGDDRGSLFPTERYAVRPVDRLTD